MPLNQPIETTIKTCHEINQDKLRTTLGFRGKNRDCLGDMNKGGRGEAFRGVSSVCRLSVRFTMVNFASGIISEAAQLARPLVCTLSERVRAISFTQAHDTPPQTHSHAHNE